MPIKKIIHISDLHIGKTNDYELQKFAQIVTSIRDKYKNEADSTIILITGDLVNDGSSCQYHAITSELQKLRQDNFKVWPIPGNHDYGKMGIFPRKSSKMQFYNNIVRNFNFGNFKFMKYPQEFSPDDNIVFFGLNSMNVKIRWVQAARGCLGIRQILRLYFKLKAAKKRNPNIITIIFLHHHPIKLLGFEEMWMRLVGGWLLMRAIKGKVDVLLFGHDHWHFDYTSKTKMALKWGVKNILSCTQSTNPIHAQYSVSAEGKILIDDVIQTGLLGWEIRIDNNGQITPISILL